VYLDGGLEAARKTVDLWLGAAVKEARARPPAVRHPKSRLQEWLQKEGRGTPSYRVIGQDGPAHDAIWTIEAILDDGSVVGQGKGSSKRQAATLAAERALEALTGDPS
jgi:ribonuclease-3